MFSQAPSGDLSWRERALARSLEAPRARSVERIERLVGAARDLANETGTATFTVHQVIERSGLSLKGFYRCFEGKDDLLVALLEEDSRLGATILADIVDRASEPEARLEAYVTGVFALLTHEGALGYAGVLVREHRRLSEAHPDELARAIAPMVDVLILEVSAAADAGVVSSDDPTRDAATIFALVLEGIHDVTLGRVDALDQAEYLWRFCRAALRGDRSVPDQENR
ncbi:MAG TPA: TetR/AcrR family transcriptional regulator [Acidimicrobiia bacterium]|nr:TetR/AcrR family transcriptional regulator [Acidimicrobiia bacterium]